MHSKARKKMVGLAAAYRRQLQYEEQQLKSHLTKMNEISFSKKYTTDGKEFFHSKAEMDAFYKQIEDEKKKEETGNSKQDIKDKFMKVRRGEKETWRMALKMSVIQSQNDGLRRLIHEIFTKGTTTYFMTPLLPNS